LGPGVWRIPSGEPGQPVVYEYRSDVIGAYIKSHPEYENIVIALSGDVGFYSGAKKLLDVLNGRKPEGVLADDFKGQEDSEKGNGCVSIEIICGISSVVYFMSQIGLSWDDAKITSRPRQKLQFGFHDQAESEGFFPFWEQKVRLRNLHRNWWNMRWEM